VPFTGRTNDAADEKEFIAGAVFAPGQDLTAPIYNMLTLVEAPMPTKSLFSREECAHCDKFLTFLDYIGKAYALLSKRVRGRNPVYDDVIHRLAFAFTISPSICAYRVLTNTVHNRTVVYAASLSFSPMKKNCRFWSEQFLPGKLLFGFRRNIITNPFLRTPFHLG